MASIKKLNASGQGGLNYFNIKPGDVFSGYVVKKTNILESIDAVMIQLEHIVTGTRHIHIANSDKENTFSVIFRTVPEDSTGVAHILEHTVLCGSEKYNVRDPFFSMIKRSLSTFMNAFTASDWTMYPFSTQNHKDYFNLMEVYLDAAFFPKLDITSFKQEGHRLEIKEPEKADDPVELEYKGVVYNEMKGAMSSPSQVMGRALLKALYPSTTYSHNSGGEPSQIPRLSHGDLKAFHAKYYHPSNAFFYTYGTFDLASTLSFIENKVLNRFQKLEFDSTVPSQPRWEQPRVAGDSYMFSKEEDPAKKYQACVAWLTADIRNDFEILVLMVLEQILIGNAASPLRKALIDSNLGSALSDASGFDPDNRDTMFVCGLKDISLDSATEIETLIFSTLENLVTTKIPQKMIDSAIHQIEFSRKEITNTPHPHGIKLLLSISATLVHEGDPAACINIDKDLERLQKEIQNGPFLEQKIKEYFLDNPHRVLFTLSPDQTQEETEIARTKEELNAILKTLSKKDLDAIEKDAEALSRLQEAEEDVSSLPTLDIADVPPEIEVIRPDDISSLSLVTGYEKATSDILYFTCPAGAQNIPEDLFILIPFFCKAFTSCGTRNMDYVQIAELIDLYTGGISVSPFSGSFFNSTRKCHAFLSIQGKALDRNVDRLFDIMKELIENYSFKDLERLKQLLLQYRASLEGSIVSSGHVYAISLSGRNLSAAAYINELWHGVTQYQYIKKLTQPLEKKPASLDCLNELSQNLTTIAKAICQKNNFKPAAVGSRLSIETADRHISDIHNSFEGNGNHLFLAPEILPDTKFPFDGWYTNTAVSFVAQSFKTARMSHDDAPGLAVISRILRSMYLHKEIREKGGAYGGFASYDSEEGIFSFGSYRDPHITRTMDIYHSACDFITHGSYSENDIKEAVLQVCSDIDKPETPGPASIKAFYRSITGMTDDMRLQFKNRLLEMNKPLVQQIARKYFTIDDSLKGTAVISSKERLEAANITLKKTGSPLTLFSI